jgi:uncharacterized membrane protein (TIGR02234 family)
VTVAATEVAPDPRAKARRELAAVVVVCAVAALVELFAAGRPWAKVTGIAGTTHSVSGNELASAVRPLAFVALAGAAALLATRRWGRVAVGVLIAVAGAGLAIAAAAAGHPSASGVVQELPAWRGVALVASIPVLLSGLAAAARGNRWSVMSAKYDAPGTPRQQDPDVELWDALDRGDDPTG